MGRRFEGKVAIVTASTQGIGFGIAERLGLEGASVVISSRKQKNVDDAVEKLRAKGIEQVLGLVCHVSNAKQRKDLIHQTLQKFGHLDVIVSNAAANPSIDPILAMQESVLDKLWDINVKASILLLQDAAAHLHKGSAVILISSIEGYHPHASMAMYGVTKTALLGLTKPLEVGTNVAELEDQGMDRVAAGDENLVVVSQETGFFLNPRFHYQEGFVYTDHIRSGVMKVIERLAPNVTFVIEATREALASEMAPNTRVNCVAPGFVPTRFADFITKNEGLRTSIEENTPLGRLGSTDDMAAAVAFLASDEASYITGETIIVAGGAPSRL